jgi:hypothetical protein
MIYVEAPEIVDKEALPSVFLAGGISNCENWQAQMVEALKHLNIIIYNPHRKNFSMDDSKVTNQQIMWEFEHLRKATVVSFWFSKETICPIVLYELGNFNMTSKPIVIGIDPEYSRKLDVEIQTRLARPEVPIVYESCERKPRPLWAGMNRAL